MSFMYEKKIAHTTKKNKYLFSQLCIEMHVSFSLSPYLTDDSVLWTIWFLHQMHNSCKSLCIVTAADFKPFTKLHSSQLLTERTDSRQYETAAKNKLEFYRAEWEAGGDNEVE